MRQIAYESKITNMIFIYETLEEAQVDMEVMQTAGWHIITQHSGDSTFNTLDASHPYGVEYSKEELW